MNNGKKTTGIYSKLNWRKQTKVTVLLVLFLGLVLIGAGCDVMQISTYDIEVKISRITEDEAENLSVRANGQVLDNLDYDSEEEVARGTFTGLQGRKDIRPDHDDLDFYPREAIEVSSSDDGKEIEFNVTKVEQLTSNESLQNYLQNEAWPGDKIELASGDYEKVEVEDDMPGLIFQHGFGTDRPVIAGFKIEADDVEIKGFSVPGGNKMEVTGSENLRLEDNIINGTGSLSTGLEISDSEVLLFDNEITNHNTGVDIKSNSRVELHEGNIINDNNTGLEISNSDIRAIDNEVSNNEYGIKAVSGSDIYLTKNSITRNEEYGVKTRHSDLKAEDNDVFFRNRRGLVAENSRSFILQGETVDRSTKENIMVTGGTVELFEVEIIDSEDESGLVLENLDRVEIINSEITDNNKAGLSIIDSSNLQISNNDFEYNGEEGIIIDNSSGEISESTFNRNEVGVRKTGATKITLEYNDFSRNNDYGLEVTGGEAAVKYNDFSDNNKVAAVFTGRDTVADSILNYNNFSFNELAVRADIEGGLEAELDARYNWWNADSEEEIEALLDGPIDFSDWESEKIPEAGRE